jgi:catechol 2,3-dioxygenase-like lactoylglutathione lyase family enzyme
MHFDCRKGYIIMANKRIQGMGFHHIALKAKDFEASLKFYTEGLGMEFYTQWGEGDKRIAMLDLGDGSILELFAGGMAYTQCSRGSADSSRLPRSRGGAFPRRYRMG